MSSRLCRDNVAESTRGPGDGYTLARRAAAISVADVVRAVDEPAIDGVSPDPCAALWQRLNGVMLEHMSRISLDSLVKEPIARGAVVSSQSPSPGPTARPVVKALRSTASNAVFAFGWSFAA